MSSLLRLITPFSFIIQSLIGAFFIENTERGSPIRLLGIFLIYAVFYFGFIMAPTVTSSDYYNGFFSSWPFMQSVQLTNLLWIIGINKDELKAKASKGIFITPFGISQNYRGIRTKWQTKNVPAFPAYYGVGSAPKRGQYLLRQTAFVVWYVLIIDFLDSTASQQSAEEKERLFGPGTEYAYFNATAEQWVFRVTSSIMSWFLGARAIIDCFYRIYSIVMVGTNLALTEEFPPHFGSMWDAYTIRNYWG
jgi:hypothetical protein